MFKKCQKINDTYSLVQFDSVTEMVEQCLNPESSNEASRAKHLENIERGASVFTNKYTARKVLKELSNPPTAAARVRDIVREIESEHEFKSTRRRLAHRREDGGELNAGAWVRRELDGWNRMERTAFNRKVVRIAVNIGITCRGKPEQTYYRGAAAIALADALDAAGHSVEIVAITCGKGVDTSMPFNHRIVVETIAKHSDTPMDIDSMSLICAEIGFFRTIGFCCRSSVVNGRIDNDMGETVPVPNEVESEYDLLIDSDVKTLDRAKEIVERYATEFEA